MKESDFGPPFIMGNRMLYCRERYPLLLECFITFLEWIRMIEELLVRHTGPFWSTPCHYRQQLLSNFK